MADEPQGGTPAGEGGNAAETPTAGTPPKDGADGGETAEQRAARLEKELADQKALNLSQKSKVEEANRLLQELKSQAPQTPAGAGGDPLETEINWLRGQIAATEALFREYPNNVEIGNQIYLLRKNLQEASLRKQAADQQRAWQEQLRNAEPEILALPARHQAKTRELFATGHYLNVPAAYAAAKGSALPDDFDVESERQRLAAKEAELEKDRQARANGVLSTGSRPVFTLTKPEAGKTLKLTRAQLREIQGLPLNDERRIAYSAAYSSGQVEVID